MLRPNNKSASCISSVFCFQRRLFFVPSSVCLDVKGRGGPMLPHGGHDPRRKNNKSNKAPRRSVIDHMFKARSSHQDARDAASIQLSEADPSPVQQSHMIPKHLQAKRTSPRPMSFVDDVDDVDPEVGSTALSPVGSDGLAASAMNGALDRPVVDQLIDDSYTYLSADPKPAVIAPGTPMVPPGLTRYKMELQFRGDHFFGWDRAALHKQKHDPTVLAHRVKTVDPLKLHSASDEDFADNFDRTLPGVRSVRDSVQDALAIALDLPHVEVISSCILEQGVHARRLTCHVDIPSELEMQPRTVLHRAHMYLEKKQEPLGILSFERAAFGFHARHSARRRVFLYRMLNRIAPPLFEVGAQYHVDRYLDVDKMNQIAKQHFEGTRDFGSMADYKIWRQVLKSRVVNPTTRTIEKIDVVRQEDEVLIWIVGSSFLRHQIRNIAGVLKWVGQGVWNEYQVRKLMQQGISRSPSAEHMRPPAAPAMGLTLFKVEYDAADETTPDFVDSGELPLNAEEFQRRETPTEQLESGGTRSQLLDEGLHSSSEGQKEAMGILSAAKGDRSTTSQRRLQNHDSVGTL